MAPKKQLRDMRINLTGCSGIGKTTLAKAISEIYDVPFISGSYSDLVPETRNIPHSEMIQQDAQTVFKQDVQVLNIRNKVFGEKERLVSDRSYIDSAAYMIQKLSHRLPTCDIEDFVEKCKILTLLQCPKVIYLPYTPQYFQEWEIEDNGKRVLNKLYQAEVTAIINYLIDYYWNGTIVSILKATNEKAWYSNPVIEITGTFDGSTELYSQILVLNELDHENRLEIIDKFLAL